MFGRRGFLEISAEILYLLKESPKRKTLLSNRCKFDSRYLTRYLDLMEKTNLISKSEEDPKFFEITPKGVLYLKKYQELIKPIEKIKENFND